MRYRLVHQILLLCALAGLASCKPKDNGESGLKDAISATERLAFLQELANITGKQVLIRERTLERTKATQIRSLFTAPGINRQLFAFYSYIELKAKATYPTAPISYFLNVYPQTNQQQLRYAVLGTIYYDQITSPSQFVNQANLTASVLQQSVTLADQLNRSRRYPFALKPPTRPEDVFDTQDQTNYSDPTKRQAIIGNFTTALATFRTLEAALLAWRSPLREVTLNLRGQKINNIRPPGWDPVGYNSGLFPSLYLNLSAQPKDLIERIQLLDKVEGEARALETTLAKEFGYNSVSIASRDYWNYSMTDILAAVNKLRAVKDQIASRYGYGKLVIGPDRYLNLPFTSMYDSTTKKLQATIKIDKNTSDLSMLPGYFGSFAAMTEVSPRDKDAYRFKFSTQDGESLVFCEVDGSQKCDSSSAGYGTADKLGWTPAKDRLLWETNEFVKMRDGLKLLVIVKEKDGKDKWRQELVFER